MGKFDFSLETKTDIMAQSAFIYRQITLSLQVKADILAQSPLNYGQIRLSL